MPIISPSVSVQVINESKPNTSNANEPERLSEGRLRELFRENNVGIPIEHAVKLQSVAKEKNTVFGIRPVESMVRQLIEEGYPTKGFKVKGKSSNWGPQAGFICENQQLSKRENRGEEHVQNLNEAIQKGKENGSYSVSDLRISKARISELVSDLDLISTSGSSDNITMHAKSPSGADYTFHAKKGDDGLYSIYQDGADKPVQVLSHPVTNLPLTADYDLFLTAPAIEEHAQSGVDSRPNTSVTYTEFPGDTKSEAEFNAREDKDMGNISPRIRGLVESLNDQLGRGEHLDMFHHNDDAGSPASDMRDNFPATFYLPRPISATIDGEKVHFKEVSVIHNDDEFKDFIRCIKDNGYHFTSNPKWETPNRPSFDSAKQAFEALSRA